MACCCSMPCHSHHVGCSCSWTPCCSCVHSTRSSELSAPVRQSLQLTDDIHMCLFMLCRLQQQLDALLATRAQQAEQRAQKPSRLARLANVNRRNAAINFQNAMKNVGSAPANQKVGCFPLRVAAMLIGRAWRESLSWKLLGSQLQRCAHWACQTRAHSWVASCRWSKAASRASASAPHMPPVQHQAVPVGPWFTGCD